MKTGLENAQHELAQMRQRQSDVTADETHAFRSLIEAAESYAVARKHYVDNGDEESYLVLKRLSFVIRSNARYLTKGE